jgi:DNA-binding transcriptional MerR regulator
MKGSRVQKHPSRAEIEQMLRDGNSPTEVSNWLKVKYKHRRHWLSGVTLTEYRTNFLNLSREEAAEKRKALLAEGKTRDANELGIHASNQELIEARQEMTQKAIDVMTNYKSMQEKIMERISLMDSKTRDADGNLMYKARDEEILQGWITQLRGLNLDFIKATADLKKQESQSSNVGISITVAEMGKYQEAFKTIFQKILIKLDPSLINEALQIYKEEMDKVSGSGDGVNITVNSGDTQTTNINISTSTQDIQTNNMSVDAGSAIEIVSTEPENKGE